MLSFVFTHRNTFLSSNIRTENIQLIGTPHPQAWAHHPPHLPPTKQPASEAEAAATVIQHFTAEMPHRRHNSPPRRGERGGTRRKRSKGESENPSPLKHLKPSVATPRTP